MSEEDSVIAASPACVSRPGIPVASEEPPQGTPFAFHAGMAKGHDMAQLDIPIAQKKCATCRWWSGTRKLIFVGADPKFVRIGGVLPAVACRAWDGRKFGGAMTCFRWSKWEKL